MKLKKWMVLFLFLPVVFYCDKVGEEYKRDSKNYINWTYFNTQQESRGYFFVLLQGQCLNGKLVQAGIDTYVFDSRKEALRAFKLYNSRDRAYRFIKRADIDSLSLRRLVEASINKKLNSNLLFIDKIVAYECLYVQFLYKDNEKIRSASRYGQEMEDKFKKHVEIFIRSKEKLFPDVKLKKDKREERFSLLFN